MNILIDGLPVHYQIQGEGPVVLMLHGWGSNLATFDLLANSLSKDHSVLRLDLPGMGRSGRPPLEGWTVYNYAAFVSRFMSKLGVRDLDAVIGHSMGGRIAIKALAEQIVDADKLVLIAAAGITDSSAKKSSYGLVAKIGKVLTAPLPNSFRDRLRNRLYASAGASDYLEVDDSMKATFQKVIEEDLRPDAAKIIERTLLIYGTEDAQTPVSFGQIYNGLISGSKLEIVVGGDHFVHQNSADTVSRLVEGFLA